MSAGAQHAASWPQKAWLGSQREGINLYNLVPDGSRPAVSDASYYRAGEKYCLFFPAQFVFRLGYYISDLASQ